MRSETGVVMNGSPKLARVLRFAKAHGIVFGFTEHQELTVYRPLHALIYTMQHKTVDLAFGYCFKREELLKLKELAWNDQPGSAVLTVKEHVACLEAGKIVYPREHPTNLGYSLRVIPPQVWKTFEYHPADEKLCEVNLRMYIKRQL